MITTVLGEIDSSALGVTASHEHIFIDMRGCVEITGTEPQSFYDPFSILSRADVALDPYAVLDNARIDSFEDACKELAYFKEHGGESIIDCTPDEIGRDPAALKALSQKTGINIVAGCGHYYERSHFPYLKDATVTELADEMRQDLLVGIKGTDVRAGIIGEIGTSAVVSENEKKVLHAAGIVSAETDKAVHVHTDLYTENGIEIIKILTSEGMRPERICIDHVDVWLRPDYIRKLLDAGVYVEFDNFGKEFYVSEKRRFAYDLERVKVLKMLIDEGYGDKILLCNDICLKSMLRIFGGLGYAHILRGVKAMALENGISEETYQGILTENVKRFID